METPFHATPTQRCLVYDKRTGRVIHVHDYIGADRKARLSNTEMEAQALTYAGDQVKKEYLAIAEATGDLSAPDITYRVDTATGKVIASALGQDARSMQEASPGGESTDLGAVKRSLASWKTITVIALLIAIAALAVGWLL